MDAPDIDELTPPDRTLMGPGPSDVHPRVLRAMATPLVGYLDPSFVEVMDDVQRGLRYLFQTDNEHTLAVSGTGSAAMECAFGNLVEPGETVLVPDNGYFGARMGQMAERAGGEVVPVSAPWGEPLAAADVEAALDDYQPSVVGLVHGETSTGVRQGEVDRITTAAHEHDACVVVDTVASLGGVEFRTDDWDVDVVYSGSQKCLSAPPGASPITFSERAVEKIRARDAPSDSWYLDLEGLWSYWGDDPSYHHTGMTSTLYAAREALRLVAEEGIEARWDRHSRMSAALVAGVEAMGLDLRPAPADRLPSLNAVSIPDSADGDALCDRMLEAHDIEIAGGLGDLSGAIVRVGCMGHSARPSNVLETVGALGRSLEAQGVDVDTGAGVAATNATLE
ncbi:pyridoxal-phosphate-dependent aminotransferase family protein [Halorarius halobius]|uniref:pyridoxal-phosphate-dependent aminotransferase family protein n=1 Tax=Halorarius halobius TaxID=2962671 RepID=UPI0020CF93E2|nr:alanine--glyoxylate aminotransferase family protein [Halorarius halobius]